MRNKLGIIITLIISFFVLIAVPSASAETLNWQKVVGSGTAPSSGFGTINNLAIMSMASFGNQLYAGTSADTGGGQIWRYDGNSWQEVVGDAVGGGNGFSDPNNADISAMAVFGNYLYAATTNSSTGAEVWRTSNGTDWSQVNTNGFSGTTDNASVFALGSFNGNLYAGTYNETTGTEIWSSANGTNWIQANIDGFDGTNANDETLALTVFGNYLYAGTYNDDTGTEIWRTSNGEDWTQTNTDGFGAGNANPSTLALTSFNNYLYATTINISGAEVWKSSDGQIWNKVVGSGLGGTNSNGFGNRGNVFIRAFTVFNGYLYAGTTNFSVMGPNSIKNQNDSGIFSIMDEITPGPGASEGTEIWRSADGENWSQTNINGFTNINNVGTFALLPFNGLLYAGTWNDIGGTEIWRTDAAGPSQLAPTGMDTKDWIFLSFILFFAISLTTVTVYAKIKDE